MRRRAEGESANGSAGRRPVQALVGALLLGVLATAALVGADEAITIPPENRATLAREAAPPPRPDARALQEPAARLFEAIVRDQPELAADLFFPRAAFVLVKAMPRPERYYDRLRRRYDADIHALHRSTPELARAQFVALELGRRGGFVRPFEEGNRLPYWAARHARLRYRVGDVPQAQRELEVRVLISWGTRWYVIHLSDF